MKRPAHTVVYDHQTFVLQAFGGISRYFCELAVRVNAAEDFRSAVVAPLHFNSHLAQSGVPRSGIHLATDDARIQRLCRGADRLLAPVLTRLWSPSLIHRTFFKPLGRPQNRPLVLTVFDMIHEIFTDQFDASDPVVREKRQSIDQADHILCISESTARDLMRLFGTPAAKISVTHLGYSSIFDAEPDASAAASVDRPYILYVGHRDGYKNFANVLQAYAASDRLQSEMDLVLFGGPPLTTQEQALIDRLAIARERVLHRRGGDDRLAAAYRGARAFIYPSKYEGFGIPPLEAMASGCPVACSNASSIPEVVGDAARLFDPASPDDIRDAIEQLCFDDDLHARLQTAGRQRARHFSWDRCAAETMDAYRKLLDAGPQV